MIELPDKCPHEYAVLSDAEDLRDVEAEMAARAL